MSGHSDYSSEASGHLEQDTDPGTWSILYKNLVWRSVYSPASVAACSSVLTVPAYASST